jgi:hypothetical protein
MMIWIDLWYVYVVFVMLLDGYVFKCRFEFVFVQNEEKESFGEKLESDLRAFGGHNTPRNTHHISHTTRPTHTPLNHPQYVAPRTTSPPTSPSCRFHPFRFLLHSNLSSSLKHFKSGSSPTYKVPPSSDPLHPRAQSSVNNSR